MRAMQRWSGTHLGRPHWCRPDGRLSKTESQRLSGNCGEVLGRQVFFCEKKTGEAFFGRGFLDDFDEFGIFRLCDFQRFPSTYLSSSATLGAVWGLQICDQVSCFLDKPKAPFMGDFERGRMTNSKVGLKSITVAWCGLKQHEGSTNWPKMGTMNWTWGYFFDGVQNFTCYC